jgi:Diphthamide synthase
MSPRWGFQGRFIFEQALSLPFCVLDRLKPILQPCLPALLPSKMLRPIQHFFAYLPYLCTPKQRNMKEKVIFNWSGGKDSALCLYKTLQAQEADIHCLLTSVSKQYQRISMHGVRVELLEAQARNIGLPLVKMEVPEMPTMEAYEQTMQEILQPLQKEGATACMFGDIFLEDLKIQRRKIGSFGLERHFSVVEQTY